MKKSSALAYVGHNERGDREKDDFYPTPELATQALLDRQKFQGDIWECACGNGAMSKVMINNGYNVYSSDLIDRGYGERKDFLSILPPHIIIPIFFSGGATNSLSYLKKLV